MLLRRRHHTPLAAYPKDSLKRELKEACTFILARRDKDDEVTAIFLNYPMDASIEVDLQRSCYDCVRVISISDGRIKGVPTSWTSGSSAKALVRLVEPLVAGVTYNATREN